VVYWKEEYYIQDLGRIGYDEKYFDEARFDYPEASSIGHNVLFVNGEKQISGKYYKKPYDYTVGGKVLDFRSTEKRDYVLMDPTNAYPKKELKNWRRHVVLEKPEITLVLDEVRAEPGSKIEVRFHPGVDYEIQNGMVLLEGAEGTMALIPLMDQEIVPGRHASQFVNATKDFHWLDYFDTEVIADDVKTTLATLILPVESTEQAKELAASIEVVKDASGGTTITFTTNNERSVFEFKVANGDLTLK
jgi:hypothetical protein